MITTLAAKNGAAVSHHCIFEAPLPEEDPRQKPMTKVEQHQRPHYLDIGFL